MYLKPIKIAALFCGVLSAWLSGSVIFAAGGRLAALSSKEKRASSVKMQGLTLPGVHNVFRLSENLITGSQPEGDRAFQALAALGVKTIITVDSAKPDIERAQKYGMRYVQIPFG